MYICFPKNSLEIVLLIASEQVNLWNLGKNLES